MGNNPRPSSQSFRSTSSNPASDQRPANHSNGSQTSTVPSDGASALNGEQNHPTECHLSNTSRLQEDIAGIGSWLDSTPDLQKAMESGPVLESN